MKLDLPLWLAQLALLGLGLSLLASADEGGLVTRQAAYALLGLLVQLALAMTRPRDWVRLHRQAYALGLLALLAVVVVGATSKGAQRWLGLGPLSFQPSEPMKLCLIATLSVWLGEARVPGLAWRAPFWRCLGAAALPALLVLRQPDLGTAAVLMFLFFLLMALAGYPLERLLGLLVLGLLALPMVMHRYQIERLLIFLDPQKDPLGAGWNLIQAEMAVGSGGWLGYGLGHGPLTRSDMVPEQHTDFIFTVAGEELGFLGCLGILTLYALLLGRGLWLARRCPQLQGRLLGQGVVGMIGFHAVVNISMVLGLLPVTGVPLPFLSYGGTALWTSCAGLGMLQALANAPAETLAPNPAYFEDPDRRRVWSVKKPASEESV